MSSLYTKWPMTSAMMVCYLIWYRTRVINISHFEETNTIFGGWFLAIHQIMASCETNGNRYFMSCNAYSMPELINTALSSSCVSNPLRSLWYWWLGHEQAMEMIVGYGYVSNFANFSFSCATVNTGLAYVTSVNIVPHATCALANISMIDA